MNKLVKLHIDLEETGERHISILTQDVNGMYAAYQEPFVDFPTCNNDLWVIAGRGYKMSFARASRVFGNLKEDKYRA
jgi:hypothetical protein